MILDANWNELNKALLDGNKSKFLQLLNITPTENKQVIVRLKGGVGSGNFDHSGRPGEVGGSSATGNTKFLLPQTIDERLDQAIANRVCTTKDGSYIWRSSGRRKYGRPYKYGVHLADGNSFTVLAYNDEEAVSKANDKLKKE